MQIQSGFEPMTPIAHMKNKKILEKRGLELQISGRESKTLPLDHCVIAWKKVLKYWRNQSISPAALLVFLSFLVPNHSLLANFSQFPPLCANFHPYSTHLHPLRQLFFVYDFLVIPCSLFENILFWLYFWNPCRDPNCFCN